MEIKNVGQLRKIIENLPDDFEIEMRVRRKLTDEELKNCRYPYINGNTKRNLNH